MRVLHIGWVTVGPVAAAVHNGNDINVWSLDLLDSAFHIPYLD